MDSHPPAVIEATDLVEKKRYRKVRGFFGTQVSNLVIPVQRLIHLCGMAFTHGHDGFIVL